MPRNLIIQIRASRQEYERMRDAMIARGFSSMSAFLRSLAMDRDFWIEKKLQEVCVTSKEIHKLLQNRR